MAFYTNPCYCWPLLEAVTLISIWSIGYSLAQLAIFTWLSVAIAFEHGRFADDPFEFDYHSYDMGNSPYRYSPGDWLTAGGKYYLALFLTQLSGIFLSVILFFSSFGLLFEVKRVSTDSSVLICSWP